MSARIILVLLLVSLSCGSAMAYDDYYYDDHHHDNDNDNTWLYVGAGIAATAVLVTAIIVFRPRSPHLVEGDSQTTKPKTTFEVRPTGFCVRF